MSSDSTWAQRLAVSDQDQYRQGCPDDVLEPKTGHVFEAITCVAGVRERGPVRAVLVTIAESGPEQATIWFTGSRAGLGDAIWGDRLPTVRDRIGSLRRHPCAVERLPATIRATDGITVNSVMPGTAHTEWQYPSWLPNSEERRARPMARVPMARLLLGLFLSAPRVAYRAGQSSSCSGVASPLVQE